MNISPIITAIVISSLISFTGCSNSNPDLITKDIEVTGTITGDLCEGVGKCIPFLVIYPAGLSFEYSDWVKVKPLFGQEVRISGDIVSEIEVYSCEDDYFDGMQHPINEKCDIPDLKYYETNTYLKVNSIEQIQQ